MGRHRSCKLCRVDWHRIAHLGRSGMPINTGTETSSIRIDATGSITAAFRISSHGQGLETTLAQVIADELGCKLEMLRSSTETVH